MAEFTISLHRGFTYEQKDYSELHFDFEKLTNKDSAEVIYELARKGIYVAVKQIYDEYIQAMCIRACTDKIGFDLFDYVSLVDTEVIQDAFLPYIAPEDPIECNAEEGTYKFKLTKPIEFESEKYETLTFGFDRLTGSDARRARQICNSHGNPIVTKSKTVNEEYMQNLCSIACLEVRKDLFNLLSLKDGISIINTCSKLFR